MRALMHTVTVALILCAGCVQEVEPTIPLDVPTSLRVTVPEAERGAPDARIPFATDSVPVTVDLEVIDGTGALMSSFDGWVEIRIEPGEVDRIEVPDGPAPVGSFVAVPGGERRGVVVWVRKSFGDARLWVEDVGYVPSDPATAACNNGMDDDGDGRIDFPEDDGCRFSNDGTEAPGSHAAGVSETLFFANPSLADVQGRQGSSPLEGRRVTVDVGEMIVTRVTTDGFYVTEIDDAGAPVLWSSMFVFNFNTPPFLRACDRITSVSGSIGEFFGFTEMTFPSWEREAWDPEDGPCPIPEPFLADATVLGTPDMEARESALVRVVDATMPSFFGPERPSGGGGAVFTFGPNASNCDLDGDGDVNLARGGREAQCNDECADRAACSEWSTFVEFGQFVVQTDGAVINVVTRDGIPDFEPDEHRGETFAAITGTLRHFSPLGAQRGYILEPRCAADLVQTGDPAPASEACVTPRTGGPDDPE